MALRYDTQRFDRVEHLATGALRIPATITRSGVFAYTEGGKVVREWRPPEEVQRADFLASLDDLPVTIGHPKKGVSPANFGRESVGHVRAGSAVAEGRDVNGALIVARGDGVEGARNKTLVDTSFGFQCRIDPTPGVTPEGEPYDRVQRDLVGNHTALLRRGDGRTGSQMRLDGADQVIEDDGPPMKTITIRVDGKAVEIEVSDAAAAHIARLEAERDAGVARADAQGAVIAKHDAEVAAAARAGLENTARRILGPTFALTRKDGAAEVGLSDDEIRVAVVRRTDSAFDMTGRDAAYLRARFDIATAPAAPSNSPAAPVLNELNGGGQDPAQRADAGTAAPTPETDPVAYVAQAEAKLAERIRTGA